METHFFGMVLIILHHIMEMFKRITGPSARPGSFHPDDSPVLPELYSEQEDRIKRCGQIKTSVNAARILIKLPGIGRKP
jgi:hypothetical protein